MRLNRRFSTQIVYVYQSKTINYGKMSILQRVVFGWEHFSTMHVNNFSDESVGEQQSPFFPAQKPTKLHACV